MRLAFIQFGDFRDAFERFRQGGGETYYAQRYSVDFVERLAERCDFLGVCAMLGETAYEATVTERLHSACIPRLLGGRLDDAAIVALLNRWRPTHIILQTPSRGVLAWALRRKIAVLPLLADSWRTTGVKARLDGFRHARLFNDPRIAVVANHNAPASLSLKRIGVRPEKIVPWDWPHALVPEDHPVKSPPLESAQAPLLLFVGQLTEAKGAGECIGAAAILKERGVDFRMKLIGGGDFEARAKDEVRARGLADRVEIAGRRPHAEVIEAGRAASLALVPTHHAYPEGLPMTIYEALATRTPLIVSDHPMFLPYLANAPAAKVVPEKRPDALADAIASFLADAAAYRRASEATEETWRRIKCDLTWGALIEAWLKDPARARERLRDYALDRRLETLGMTD
ncbi:MAG: glycosyltransferase [Amphiplicatus sp.]